MTNPTTTGSVCWPNRSDLLIMFARQSNLDATFAAEGQAACDSSAAHTGRSDPDRHYQQSSAENSNLDIDKAQWQLKDTKTKRLPASQTYAFGSAMLTSPSFTFPRGIFEDSAARLILPTTPRFHFHRVRRHTSSLKWLSRCRNFIKSILRCGSRNYRSI